MIVNGRYIYIIYCVCVCVCVVCMYDGYVLSEQQACNRAVKGLCSRWLTLNYYYPEGIWTRDRNFLLENECHSVCRPL